MQQVKYTESLLPAKKLNSDGEISHLYMQLNRHRSSRTERKQHRLERDSEKWVKSEKGQSDRDLLTSVLQNRWPLTAEFPSQTEQNEALESMTQTWEQSFSVLQVLLILLSLVGFPTKTHTSQVCK